MSDPIHAALDAAGEAARLEACRPGCCGEGTGCEIGPCYCSTVAARAAVAAFLRALDAACEQGTAPDGRMWTLLHGAGLAAAVERAARGETGDE